MISSSSSSFCSHSSKHFPTSKDWTGSYADSHVHVDPNIVFGWKSPNINPLTLESTIPSSKPTRTRAKDCMTEFYENIRGYPSNYIKRDLQASSFQKHRLPLEPLLSSYSIDSSLDTSSLSSNMKRKSEEVPKDSREFSIDSTSSPWKEIEMNQAIYKRDGKVVDYCFMNGVSSLLTSCDSAVIPDPESFHTTYHSGRIIQDKDLFERCSSTESRALTLSHASSGATFPNNAQPIPSLDDSTKVLARYSSTMLKTETPSPRSNRLDLQILHLLSNDSVDDAMAMLIQKKNFRSDKRRCPNLYVTEILPTDVLLGRGGRSNHHPGNIAYRNQVGVLAPYYFQAKDKRTKTSLSQSLVNWVQKEKCGRFLKLEKDITTTSATTVTTSDTNTASSIPSLRTEGANQRWYVVSNVVACRKAAQALRECVTRNRRAPNSNA